MATSRRMRGSVAAARGSSLATAPGRSAIREERSIGYVSTSVRDKAGVYDETDKEVEGNPAVFAEGEHPAHVKVGAGLTINMGNFESLRVDCAITIPCRVDKLEEAYEQASTFVADRIAEEQARWLGTGNERKARN